MLRGALTTARDLIPEIRVPVIAAITACGTCATRGSSHTIHIAQQQVMQAITGDEVFARNADGLYADYPPLTMGGSHITEIAFAGGRHPAYSSPRTGR